MVTIEYIKDFCSTLGIVDEINENTRFNELSIDSLTVIELINNIEIDYNITIPWSSFDSSMTIGGFINHINNL